MTNDPRAELEALRRMAELEARSSNFDVSSNSASSIPQQAQQSKPSLQPTFSQELLRQGGLTLRHGLEGLGSIPQLIGAPMEAMGIRGASTNMGEMFADYLGAPKPRTSMERVVGAGSRAMASGTPLMKLGQAMQGSQALSQTAQNVGRVMASQPAAQLSMAGTSGTAAEMAKEGGLSPTAQFVAGVAAPVAAMPLIMGVQGTARTAKNIIAPLVSESAAERGAARLALKVSGKRAGQVSNAMLTADESATAGQVAAAIDNADIAALQKLSNENNATFAELVSKGVSRKIQNTRTALENTLSPVRETSLNLAKAGGVNAQPILNRIDAFRTASGNLSDDVLQNVTGDIRAKIIRLTENGSPDPAELHTIRKQLSSTIGKYSKESADWDKKKAAKVERVIQLAIDDAIDDAVMRANPNAGKLWSTGYIEPYAKGARAIRNTEELLQKEVDLASKAMGSTREIVTGTENPIKGVNLLDRIATITNTLIRATEGAAGSKVEKALTRLMAPTEFGGDKKKLGKLMVEELNKPSTFAQSLKFRPAPTRAELGYGVEEPTPKNTAPMSVVGGLLTGEQ